MNFPPVGCFLKDHNSCSFTVWAPLKKKVELLVGEDRRFSMTKDEAGYWSVTVEGIGPGAEYFFRLDDGDKLPDPASRAQPKGVHGPSAVVEEAFEWTDSGWKGLPLGDMVIYELHVGTFTRSGDFEGIVSKLPYLRDLGINAIELMPVAQFPGNRNWGYDGVYPFAAQHSYGGPRALKQLVDQAHQHGIAVVLDVVYNHQGPEGNYLSAFGPYFTDKYKTGWGKAINFDDAWCDGVRHFYWQNALMWLDEFRIDGLRLDAVHALWDFSAVPFVEILTAKVKELSKTRGRHKVLIAEFDLNNPRYISPPEKGGYGMDGQWIDEYHHALHALVTGEVDGYYEDFGDTSHLAKSLQDSYVYTGQFSVHRKKLFGKLPADAGYDQFVVFAQNHDQIGNRMLGDRLTTQLSPDGLKLTAAAFLLSPHVPMLFMGEEYGETNPFQYFISHTDAALVEAVRKGRREEFSYFKWEGEVPDPQSEKTFQQCVLSWNIQHDKDRQALFACYRYLIDFRKKRGAMAGTTRESLNVITSGNGVIAFERMHQQDYLIIVLNFNKQPVSATLPFAKKMKKIFDSTALAWNGTGEVTPATVEPEQEISLNPQSAMIFERF